MKKTCMTTGCPGPLLARGLCSRHYQQARKAGLERLPSVTLEDRFWAKVDKTTTCWLWTGSSHPMGYGQIKVDGRVCPAHRIAYELTYGSIGDGLVLDHLCRVTACVNPAHLDPVPQRINVLRGVSPMARQFRQTHCKNGHEFTERNTIWDRAHRKRRCRECNLAWVRARRRRAKAGTDRIVCEQIERKEGWK